MTDEEFKKQTRNWIKMFLSMPPTAETFKIIESIQYAITAGISEIAKRAGTQTHSEQKELVTNIRNSLAAGKKALELIWQGLDECELNDQRN
jgi:hypothetical protein